MAGDTIGVDIAKASLEACRLPDGQKRRFSHDRAGDKTGFKALKKWLDGRKIERIVYEATGVYHRAFERSMAASGLPICRVHPVSARRFAQSRGRLAKTDAIDALMLAAMGVAHEPPATRLPGQAMDELRALMGQRQSLIKDRVAEGNRLGKLHQGLECTPGIRRMPGIRWMKEQRLAQIERHSSTIDRLLQEWLDSQPECAARHRIIASIPAIGWHTALLMLAEMPELGTLSTGQAGALAGVAPITRESGEWQGKSFIQGGRKTLRHALYMPCTCRPWWPSGTTHSSRPNTTCSRRPKSHQRSPLSPSCASLSPWPMRCSGMAEAGPKKRLAHNGYFFFRSIKLDRHRPDTKLPA